MISLPTVSYGYSELNCRSGESRKSGGAERCSERALRKNHGAERGARGRGNGVQSGGYRNRLHERVAAFSPAPLRSHAQAGCSDKQN